MHQRRAFALGNFEGDDFVFEPAVFLRLQRFLMARQRELVLIFTVDVMFLGDILGGLAIIDQRIEFAHALVGKTPAEGAVVHVNIAALKRIGRFAHDPGAAGHAFDAAGDEQVAVIGFHRAARLIDRFEAGAAQAIDRCAGNRVGQTGEQGSVARDVARIFAGLIGAAEVDVFDLVFIDAGLFDHLADDVGGEIVGANVFENAAMAAHGRAHCFDDDGFSHDFT